MSDRVAFTQSALELIRQRSSHRSYTSAPLASETVDSLREAISDCVSGPFGSRVRVELIALDGVSSRQLRSWGTYGVVKGASQYLVGVSKKGETALADCGYAMETAVLHATDRGLGTCLMGATFNRGVFAKAANIGRDEIIPIISPVGYVADSHSVLDKALHFVAGSKTRRPWNELFFLGRYGALLPETQAGDYAAALEMVRLAPSAMNSQPWRVVKEPRGPTFHFYEHLTGRYGEMLKLIGGAKALMLDMGIALCHFALAAGELGLEGRWDVAEPSLIYVPSRDRYVISWTGG